MEEESNIDEGSETMDDISFVDRDPTIKTDIMDKTEEVVFPAINLRFVALQRDLPPSRTSCSRWESKRRDIKGQCREIVSDIQAIVNIDTKVAAAYLEQFLESHR